VGGVSAAQNPAAAASTADIAGTVPTGRRPGCGVGLRSAAEVAADGHATRRPPVWWLGARVRRERADAIATYLAEIAVRAQHTRIAAIRAGRHLGPVPYGYTLTRQRLTPDPLPAAVVEAIYRARIEQLLGITEIVRMLSADSRRVPPPRPHAASSGWTVGRVRAILTDPRYTGRAVLRAARRDPTLGWTPAVLTPARTHPAIIDDHTCEAAQLLAHRLLPVLTDNPPATDLPLSEQDGQRP
jgi:hypothetical protein